MDTEDGDNVVRQKDELEALESIYGDDFTIEDEFCPTISVVIHVSEIEKDEATLVVSFNSDYPSRAPPIFHLSVPWVKRNEKQTLDNSLHEAYLQHMGESIVYIWVEKLTELLIEMRKRSNNHCLNSSNPEPSDKDKMEFLTSSKVLLPTIFTGELLTDRKSTFQAHVAQIKHVQQVQLVLDELRKNKKIAAATHNMYAYRILLNEKSKLCQQDCNDGGETHAGGRLLHLLQILDCSNTLVIVTRWYGGTMLYGDRFKHINNVARQELQRQGFLNSSNNNKK